MKTSPLKRTAVTLALTLSGSLLFTSCSSTPTPPPAEASEGLAYVHGVPGGVLVNTVDITAKVTAVDQAKRKATLVGPDGKKFTVKVPPEAINFDQVKVGDELKVTLTEELVVYLGGKDSPADDGAAAVVALAPKGAQPGALAAETSQVTGVVTAIDLTKRTATIKFDDGTAKTLPVRSDVDLSQRKVGEKVVFRLTEMIAVSIERP